VRLPKRLAIALRTSVCTSSRMTVIMLFRLGIPTSLLRRPAYLGLDRFANASCESTSVLTNL